MKITLEIQKSKHGYQIVDKRYKSRERAVIEEGFLINGVRPMMSGCPIANSEEEMLEMIGESLKQYAVSNFKEF